MTHAGRYPWDPNDPYPYPEPVIMFYVSDYPPEGESVPANAAEFATLEEAREEVKRRLGDLEPWRKWDGIAEDGDVEAYHASTKDGCGGCAISKE